tara:strand:+ start:6720 stop:7499 length:780 start_codon:yes stop_codon:yes gene_type:complete
MKYGSLAGGKKIRSNIIFDVAKIFDLKFKKIINICGAVECIHSYSLIHDDLPCMDNDKLRRGKPATHVKFGESTAILAGNSLLTLAFEMIADKKYKINSNARLFIIKKLAECAGHTGIAGGQFLDLSYEKRKINSSKIINMQKKKTGKLFEFCCVAPAVIAGKNSQIKNEMSFIGEEIGFLFQITDDLLDIKGTKKNVGKPVNKDKRKGKATLVNLLGYNKTLEFAFSRKKMIISRLKKYGKKTNELIKTLNFILERTY